jgi:RHS repeat-associated protein
MVMSGRNYNAGSSYRYGFNGKEKDNSTAEGSYDFGARILDSRIGRWLSVDPLNKPFITPYNFSRNNSINFVDPDGEDEIHFYYTSITKLRNGKKFDVGGSRTQLTFEVIPKEGPDKFFYHKVTQTNNLVPYEEASKLSPAITETKYKTEITTSEQSKTEFYPFKSASYSGITQSDGAMYPGQKVDDPDLLTLAKLSPPELTKVLDAKHGGLVSLSQMSLAIGQAGREIAGAMLLLEAAPATVEQDFTKVGRWMSKKEHDAMLKTGRVQEGGGGVTYGSTEGAGYFRKEAPKGSVYVEYEVPTNSLVPGQTGAVRNVGAFC